MANQSESEDSKSKAGQPPFFETPEDLEKSVEDYFTYIKGEFHLETITPKEGEPYQEKVWDREPEYESVTGLALFLGFCSRQSFYDYEKREQFSYTIKKARLRIEAAYEQGLHRQSPTGSIFALKNFGWKDTQDVNLNDNRKSTADIFPPELDQTE